LSSSDTKVNRRRFLKYAGAAAVVVAAAAGGGYYYTTLPPPGPKKITWACQQTHFQITGNGELVKKFEDETGISVEIVQIPYETIHDKLYLEATNPGTGAYDVITQHNGNWSTAILPYLEDLKPFMDKAPLTDPQGIGSGPWAMSNVNGVQYGVPLRIGVEVRLYRKDLFDAAGVSLPKTLEEEVESCKRLTNATTSGYVGIWGGLALVDNFQDWVYANGGGIISEDGKRVEVNGDPAVHVLELWKDLYDSKAVPSGILSFNYQDAILQMQQGKAADCHTNFAYGSTIIDPAKGVVHGKIAWDTRGNPPGKNSVNGKARFYGSGWSLNIPKNAANKDLAWQFIRWLASPENDIYMAQHGNGPVRPATYKTDFASDYGDGFPDCLANALADYRTLPLVPNKAKMVDALGVELQNALLGKKSAKQALDDAAATLNGLLTSS
jgi:multiple sugar transport system substrate-binding protein